MFTGLIQGIGRIQRRGKGLMIQGCEPFSPLSIGDSVCVDGVCLTASELISDGFMAEVSEETLRRTTLGEKAADGGLVNLEPALRLSDRLGGHLVSGHVDGLGKVVSIETLQNSWQVEVSLEDLALGRYICEKASISLNGISLTVAGCSEKGSRFWIAVIPHTWCNTSMKYLTVGERVNLEVDLLAKYVENLIARAKNNNSSQEELPPAISKDWLASQGWE